MRGISRRQLVRVIAIALSLTLITPGIGLNHTRAESSYFIPDILINGYLQKKFPISRNLILFRLDLIDPDLEFKSKHQRISMSSNIAVTLSNGSNINGQLHLSSSFNYDPITRSIKLKEPTIDKINFNNMGTQNRRLLDQINILIANLFDNLTIYEIKSEEMPIIKKAPSKILIEDSGIRFFFE